ncbi:MAG: hypothetical protein ACXVDB_07305 [Tumebacillaceae bacterium]
MEKERRKQVFSQVATTQAPELLARTEKQRDAVDEVEEYRRIGGCLPVEKPHRKKRFRNPTGDCRDKNRFGLAFCCLSILLGITSKMLLEVALFAMLQPALLKPDFVLSKIKKPKIKQELYKRIVHFEEEL